MGSLGASLPVQGTTDIPDKVMPIAIVGMSCRLPGESDSPQKLWDLLSTGSSGWSQGAGDRFNLHAFHHPVTEHSGTFNTQGFHLLKQDLAQFDAQFFNISPLEAKSIDPQQRLLLEVAYESFENAGYSLEHLSGSNTGVYIAGFNSDYERILSRDPENAPFYRATGTGLAIISNRVSYCFNLKGPSLTLDTGCSGSLVALHQACQSIRNGDVDQALVGGTNLILDPETTSSLSTLKLLGDAGRCFAFDDRAQGYGRGEGLGTVVIKSLSKAIGDGDNIRAIIRNTTVNQDGKTQGITMPSRTAQEAMMLKAYADAGLDPQETSYVEAHGTGTEAGDAIEAAAIATVFSKGRDLHNPIIVGTVKTNIGHTEATAGIAGLIKTVLMLEKGMIPSNHDLKSLSSRIPISDWHLTVPKTLLPWPSCTLRRASVNSFGYGGTNAHVVLDGANDYFRHHILNQTDGYGASSLQEQTAKSSTIVDAEGITSCGVATGSECGPMATRSQRRRLFVLCSNKKEGLRTTVENLSKYAKQHEGYGAEFFENLAYTLCSRRTLLPFRLARNASTLMELQDSFTDSFLDKELTTTHKIPEQLSLCFVFTGQGAQWPGMGRELLNAYPVFEESIAAAEAQYLQLGSAWTLRTELLRDGKESRLDTASLSQALTTAVQIALVDLFKSWNIRPSVVVGHSSGEIAAAYSVGGLSFEDACNISYNRGRLVDKIGQRLAHLNGAMLAVGLSADQASEHIEALGSSKGKVCIACINSPSSVTLSGDNDKISTLQTKFERENIFNRRLVVSTAYHSHHMEIIYGEYVEALAAIKPRKFEESTRMISTVSGEDVDGEDLEKTYWARNLISPVRFSEALEKVLRLHISDNQELEQHQLAIVEIGPHSGLKGPIRQIQSAVGSSMRYNSALIRNVDAHQTVLDVAGSLITQGLGVDLDAVNLSSSHPRPRLLVDYPSYAWDRSSYWIESRLSAQYRQRKHPRHSLLGALSPDNNPLEPRWRNFIRVADMPWVKGHVVEGQIVYPASGYVCMAIEAVRQQTRSQSESENLLYVLRDVDINRALLVPDDAEGVETIFSLRPYPQSARSSSALWDEFRVFSISGNGDWSEHCRGLISVQNHVSVDDVEGTRENELLGKATEEKFAAACQQCDTDLEPSILYDHLRSTSNGYDGVFKGLTKISTKPLASLCASRIPDIQHTMPRGFDQPHCLHPVTLDLSFQAVFPALLMAGMLNEPTVLTFIEELSVSSGIESASGTEFLTHVTVTHPTGSKYRADMDIRETSKNSPLSSVAIKGLIFQTLPRGSARDRDVPKDDQNLCHRVEWVPDVTFAEPEEVRQSRAASPSNDSALETMNVMNIRAHRIIRKTLAAIEPQDEERMLPHLKLMLRWMRNVALTQYSDKDPGSMQNKSVEGEMLERIGDHVLEILKGQIHPLTIMLEGDLLNTFYKDNESIARCNSQLARYVSLLSLKNACMKIVEVGAGTGSATVPLLKAVSRRSDQVIGRPLLDRYVFTDISTGYFEKAKKLLGSWEETVEYQKLNIEEPVSEQGLGEGDYDLVVACMVLHATSVLSNTIKNVRRLLKPGGKLCLSETTRLSPSGGLIFGTLPGWWVGVDDGRIESPLLSVEQWDTLLKANGFSGIDIWLPDYESDKGLQNSVIISTAVEDHCRFQTPDIEIVLPDFGSQGLEQPRNRGELHAHQIADDFIAMKKHSGSHKTTINQQEINNRVFIVMLEIEQPFLSSCLEAEFDKVKKILLQAKGVIWITNGGAVECPTPLNAMITGLARSLRSENSSTRLITLDIHSSRETPRSVSRILWRIVENVFSVPNETPRELEYALRDGLLLIPRLTEDEEINQYLSSSPSNEIPRMEPFFQEGRALALHIGTPGLLESLAWADDLPNPSLASDEVRIEIRYGGINFRDLMVALGQLDAFSKIADECSGVVLEVGSVASKSLKIGDRVCVVGAAPYASSSVVKASSTCRIPDSMSLETAASIPIAYTTAYYSLKTVANLQRGESVLIHSAAGGLGQAAVMIAKHLGATVYITVGSSRKKTFMMNSFAIPENHIFSSRLTTFRGGIERLTAGKGVDVVLNSLAADTVRESCACLAKFGRFIEVGKRDAVVNARLSMEMFIRHVTFASVDLSLIYREKPTLFQELLHTVVDLVQTRAVGEIRPVLIMPLGEIEGAYRLMQTGKHIGKIVLKADSNTQVKVLPPPYTETKFREDSWYVVVGGTGGIGQAIIRWMARLGAKNIIAISRSGQTSKNAIALSKEMATAGINLQIQRCDIADSNQLHAILDFAAGRPISGIIQGAMMWNDALMEDMSFEQWRNTLSAKVQGTQALCSILGGSLDFFIMLSSAAGIVGSWGQGNYAAGSTFQDAFARHLSSKGCPVRSLDLSGIGNAGIVADHSETVQFLSRQAINVVPLERLMALLNYAIEHPYSRDVSHSQITLGLGFNDSSFDYHGRFDDKFSQLFAHNSHTQGPATSKETVHIATSLAGTKTMQEAVGLVCKSIVEKLATLLAINAAELNSSRSISHYGADSLIAVELRNWIVIYLQTEVQMFELLSTSSIHQVSATIASRCKLVPAFAAVEQA